MGSGRLFSLGFYDGNWQTVVLEVKSDFYMFEKSLKN